MSDSSSHNKNNISMNFHMNLDKKKLTTKTNMPNENVKHKHERTILTVLTLSSRSTEMRLMSILICSLMLH